jgi:hypothetical protein
MQELSWATPEQLGKLTLPQLTCLNSDRPPNRQRMASPYELQAIMERREAEEAEWRER